jgi:hypothetical protein
MRHDQVSPIAGGVAAPAVPRGNIFQWFAMGQFDFVPECFISMGMGRFMATIAIQLISRRMPKTRDIPGPYPVTFPALAAKEPAVNVGMARGAL